jgi:hypothetical protein
MDTPKRIPLEEEPDADAVPRIKSRKYPTVYDHTSAVLVSKICSAKGCGRVAKLAHRFLDGWISRCDHHQHRKMILDFSKIYPA